MWDIIFKSLLLIVSYLTNDTEAVIAHITQPYIIPTKSHLFVKNLINEKFSNCTLLILQDEFDSDMSFDYFAHNTNINLYNIKFNEDSISDINASLPVTFPITVGNYHRQSYQCLIALIMVIQESSQFFKKIFNTITPVYIPITRKDEDHYIFITSHEKMDKVLLNEELPMKIKFKLGVSNKKDGNLSLKSVCFFCNEGNPTIVEYEENGGKDYFPDYIINLNGRTLRVSLPYIRAKIETDAPWTGLNNARRGNWKMMIEKYLTVKFNFTYTSFVSTGMNGNFGGGGTGVQLKNGTWIGVTGDIIAGKADLGIVIANTPKRILYIDFTHSFYDIGYLTFVTAEGQRIFSPAALLWPFDIGMWGCIGLSTLFSVLFFTSLISIMKRAHLGDNENWSFKLQFQFLIASFLDQSTILPRFTPLRFFVALWLFFTMIATNIYRSKMVSLLAFPIIEEIPKTFDELAYSDYEVGFMKHGDSAYNTLAASTDPVYVKLVAEMEIDRGVGLECLEKVVKRKYGCIAYDFSLTHLIERNLSDAESRRLVFAPATTYNIWLGLGLEGKSIYRINFGKWLSYTRSFFLADIWDKMDMYDNVRLLKLKWWADTNQTEKARKSDVAESSDLTLKHFAGAFYVLLGCLSLCTIVFLSEIFRSRPKVKHFQDRAFGSLFNMLKAVRNIRQWQHKQLGTSVVVQSYM